MKQMRHLTLAGSVSVQVFRQVPRSHLHHHFLHHMFYSSAGCDHRLLLQTPEEVEKGQSAEASLL